MAILRITSGPGHGQIIECDRELVIGRAGADVVVDDAEISGRHAVVRPLPDGIEVEDLGSLNGTFVDGEQIPVPTKVRAGATLKLGVSSFAIEVGPPISDAPAPSARDETAVRGAPPEPPPAAPAGGPPSGGAPGAAPPPPIRMLMKTAPGRRLLQLLMRLPAPIRPLALFLVPVLIIALIVLIVALL